MRKHPSKPLIVFDDREWINDRLTRITGVRRYGSLHVRGRSIRDLFVSSLPDWARECLVVIGPDSNLETPASALPGLEPSAGVCVIAARGALVEPEMFGQIIERMRFADWMVVDRTRHPLFAYFPTAELFLDHWDTFRTAPLHLDPSIMASGVELAGEQVLLDIGELQPLLRFTSGSTPPRAFNAVKFDDQRYQKRSSDKQKMKAEHDYYSLIPDAMKPWMAGAFDYVETDVDAGYSMIRYNISDAAFQWIHGAWSASDYQRFLDRTFQFLSSRSRREAGKAEIEAAATELFVTKVEARKHQFLKSDGGRRILRSLPTSLGEDGLIATFERYDLLRRAHWSKFLVGELAIGHGDPCLSNVLYEPETSTLKLIDPKGATREEDLWTHPLYDYCKLSHSILGDYDFINNQLFDVFVDADAGLRLAIGDAPPPTYKTQFLQRVGQVADPIALRLGEASLFLSMLPLHLDHPRKVVAFILRAIEILDEIEKVTKKVTLVRARDEGLAVAPEHAE